MSWIALGTQILSRGLIRFPLSRCDIVVYESLHQSHAHSLQTLRILLVRHGTGLCRNKSHLGRQVTGCVLHVAIRKRGQQGALSVYRIDQAYCARAISNLHRIIETLSQQRVLETLN